MMQVARSRTLRAALVIGLLAWVPQVLAEEKSSIGYPSVAAALKALRDDPTATESTERGWTIFVRASDFEIWSFTPESHPAHPSAAKRTAYQADGGWRVSTQLLCQSTKASCDALMEAYRQLDERMKEDIRKNRGSGT